ncbi:pyridoxamine 5'-phosphate oxidase family protein [Oerskovia flava]|uniref:pyridoxamine 5'-phosphate oxidase family protein n=1 Tax=Oerskovia flava TaxID=2986422 RepID=UPI00223F0630|nr:pyridoxamine 5'-phosphate oxidase family protein [Oerskovia sp. JB1-3-2]
MTTTTDERAGAAGDEPVDTVLTEFSSPGAAPLGWEQARRVLETAEISWLSTVRPDGRPHVTPLMTVAADGTLYFCTGDAERKARNLEANPQVVLTTGTNLLDEGLDVVVEGTARTVTDDVALRRLAERWRCKYGWHFDVRDGAFWNEAGGRALVFGVRPVTVFGFGRGDQYVAMRWRFEH